MIQNNTPLSDMEKNALEWLSDAGGSVLISEVPNKNTINLFGTGNMKPGIPVFKKLAKRGLVVFTEEDPFQLEDGSWFTFTPSIELVFLPKD